MLVVPNHPQPLFHDDSQQHLQRSLESYYYPYHHPSSITSIATAESTAPLPFDDDSNSSHLINHQQASLPSSPLSTQSLLSQCVSGAAAVPRRLEPQESALYHRVPVSGQQQFALHNRPMLNTVDLMPSGDSWLPAGQQFAQKAVASNRISHQRESSLSSLGSAGPASPYSHNTSNPHIAVTDSATDGFQHGMQPSSHDDTFYQNFSKSLNPNGHDSFYANYAAYNPEALSTAAYPGLVGSHSSKQRTAASRSRPVSVASSIASDSPATPTLHETAEDERRRKHGEASALLDYYLSAYSPPPFDDDAGIHTVPKLDRTMTDIYSDELYNPNFTLTSASPSQAQIPLSPNNDMFAQRLHAINSQHLSAAHSPASSGSRDKSPFRHGSPLAPAPGHDFGSGLPPQVRFGSAQQLREQRKAEQDAQALRQQMSRNSDTSTPQTISPKDALLEFHDGDGEGANYSLFPDHNTATFGQEQASKAMANAAAAHQFDAGDLNGASAHFDYLPQLSSGIPITQQYPFVANSRQQNGASLPMRQAPTSSIPPRVSSTESSGSSAGSPGLGQPLQRPSGTQADGGTYTCTYHGCTLRFETPALLQKHKREGHRQAHSLGATRRVEPSAVSPTTGGMTSGLLNSQAGPHRCDRINPSTGKPCNTVFSRPYDLTRHEDTIHNARKKKVRCDLCTEEKTFSRADALTRHYRVCHPEVDLPGKHRRRTGSSG
ncbi:uncharacterized protein E0L32_004783 [Thyridium curvatum]|uniref:C2H2-type domain-containing protein n=1 Tax=Thyridium curvatum TaxID=1093900 RepID=A0A507AWR8_9PEZI|nr:uncharacterized protein E0L32_004783 [Thyridium curvatum]TPX15225.1 hypothetical protein E0L32_004783 [Thyridium curvatum]